jgi:predicted transcriptional regulator
MSESLSGQVVAPRGAGGQAIREARRSVLLIRVDILRIIAQGCEKPTQIMFKANVPWNVLQSQLRALDGTGFLKIDEYGSRRRYSITQWGREVLQSFQKVEDELAQPS